MSTPSTRRRVAAQLVRRCMAAGVADYAAHLRDAVVQDYCDEPARYGACANWSDLHEVCDANDYLQDADEALGVVMPDGSGSNPDVAFDDYVGFTNAAIDLVEAAWPIPTDIRVVLADVRESLGVSA